MFRLSMTLLQQYSEAYQWLSLQSEAMLNLVIDLANTNSGSYNPQGLETVLNKLTHAFQSLKGERTAIPLTDHTPALLIRKRSKAPLRILFGGHMDTVFPADSPFQTCVQEGDRLIGPGVADMKGGLVVMLFALIAFEKTSLAEQIGYDILITPDEETGSIASASLWRQYAWQNQLGLIFEPALPDGSIISSRKGSLNYTVTAKGKSAHAGRDIHLGKNAIAGLAEFVLEMHRLNSKDCSVNVGTFHGGVVSNIVPDHATCQVNIRSFDAIQLDKIEEKVDSLAKECAKNHEIELKIDMQSRRPAKPLNAVTQHLLEMYKDCMANELGLHIHDTSTGGVCDGNIVAAEGIPVLDTLGVMGGGLHTHEEWLFIPSLIERAKMALTLLLTLAENAPSKDFFTKGMLR